MHQIEGVPMTAIVIEHVPVAELPAAWHAQLTQSTGATVTVRIAQDAQYAALQESFETGDPAFGIRRDHEDTADVAGFVRKLREPRYDRRGSRTTS